MRGKPYNLGSELTENCPKCCPCCGKGDQSFIYWISEYCENRINKYIFIFFLGGPLVLDEVQLITGEQRYLKELFLKKIKSSRSNVPYVISHADYLISPIPVVNSSLELLFDWYTKKNPSQSRKRTFITNPLSTSYLNSNNSSLHNGYTVIKSPYNIFLGSRESLVATTLTTPSK
ncbi:hypothetical protein H8356DRAFT_1427682 [Neocallimastix lanati (nom. inval.)]|nr:hypothetical protein H8356DRAFT_1427682 [Neocallimastix sp. JGI-2020a]